ncbi:kinase-like protein [Cubamyces sp. BRFM 1775]|nr:kinase-like protein [Cubamyces sp. BRFM 1775]
MRDCEWVRRIQAWLLGLATTLLKSLVMALSRPQGKTHNIRAFRFKIPWIVKVTERTHSTEAHALRFLHSTGLDLPIPRLIFYCVHRGVTYTIMTCIPGVNMKGATMRGDMTPEAVETVAQEVADVLDKLQTLRQPPADAGKVMMSASGHDLPDPVTFFEERSGPFPNIIDLWVHCGSFGDLAEMEHYVEPATFNIMTADPIRYVHPDLRTYNVIVKDGHLSGIIDWEDSGWFPSSWQVHTMRWPRFGCDGPWFRFWKGYRFSEEAEAAYAASKTFCIKSPV